MAEEKPRRMNRIMILKVIMSKTIEATKMEVNRVEELARTGRHNNHSDLMSLESDRSCRATHVERMILMNTCKRMNYDDSGLEI